ncbi:MAG TPA: choice-of-anchor tandem repeat GloVer-containing protein [Opitutaceae bacterium]|nr:choice-of-anchor tandem repeat GloVer-containing protein [Opitutaceae bacterium]
MKLTPLLRHFLLAGLFGCLSSFGVLPLLATPTLNVLYQFTGVDTDGLNPEAGLVQGTDGNFYGTTNGGGTAAAGTVFKTTPAGTTTTLYSFTGVGTDGAGPLAGLVQGTDGNFYGTTEFGGSGGDGTVFKMTPAGTTTTLYSFTGAGTDGAFPLAGLVQGTDGNFYGTTEFGGSGNGNGVVFETTPAGTTTTLYSFTGVDTDGANPEAGLVQGTDGNFYGTTEFGGSGGDGTVFETTPAGTTTTLYSFTGAGTDGAGPLAGLVQGTDGNFYGTTEFGGSGGDGTVFKMTPAGTTTTLYSFTGAGTDGAFPLAGLVQGTDGNFYGTTEFGGSGNGNGVVFETTPAGTTTTLYSFTGVGTDGATPKAGLVQGTDGNFYGTTAGAGSGGDGVVFQLILSPAAAPVFSPVAGTYSSAQNVTITTATSDASIVYTTDGSSPTEVGGTVTHGTLYSGAVSFPATTTLNAMAFKSGLADSAVATAAYTIQPGIDWDIAGAAGFNGNGNSDLVWQSNVSGQRALWLMNGTTYAGSVSLGSVTTDWKIAGTADFNKNGNSDLIWQNTVNGQRAIWLMNGTTYASVVSLGNVATDWEIVGAADFNGDGYPDLIWQNTVNGQRAIWLMNGTTYVSSVSLGSVTTDWRIAGAYDFNKNGNSDLIWQNSVNGQRAIWLMNGTTYASSVSLGTVTTDWDIAGAADFNGDGKPDLIWQNTVNGQRAVWLMNGTTYVSAVSLGSVP